MCSTTWFMCASGHLIEWVTQQQAGCLQEVLHSIWLLMPPTLLVLIQRKPVTSKSQGQVYTYLWAKQSWAFSLDSQFEYELFSSIWGWKPYSVNFCMNNTVHIYEASKFIMHFMTCMFDMAWMPLASVWWDTWINTYYCVFLT